MINPKKGFFSIFSLSTVYFILYLPLILLFIYSFNSTPLLTPLHSFTLDWYKELFHNGEIWLSFVNSLIVGIGASLICLILSVLLIYYKTIGGRINHILPLFYANIIIPETVLAFSLISFFSLLKIPLGLLTIVIAHSIFGLGLVIPLIYLRFNDLNSQLLEASAMLGASNLTTFKRIVLPFMLPTLLAAGLFVFILSFDDFILGYFCAGPSAQTLSLFLVSSLRFGISPVITALTSVIILFTAFLVTLLFFFKGKEEVKG
jgi:spermidine/putrescine transport system permease protein